MKIVIKILFIYTHTHFNKIQLKVFSSKQYAAYLNFQHKKRKERKEKAQFKN